MTYQKFLIPWSRDINKKLGKYGICGKNLLWFEGYLSNRKQFI